MVRYGIRGRDSRRCRTPHRHPFRGRTRRRALRCRIGAAVPGHRAVRSVLRDCVGIAHSATRPVRYWSSTMKLRVIGVVFATALLATLSLYRETMGFPLFYLVLLA